MPTPARKIAHARVLLVASALFTEDEIATASGRGRSLVERNVAECELAVLASQSRARRLGDLDSARREIAAWEHQRNLERPTVKWHFTVAKVRRKLHFLHPDAA